MPCTLIIPVTFHVAPSDPVWFALPKPGCPLSLANVRTVVPVIDVEKLLNVLSMTLQHPDEEVAFHVVVSSLVMTMLPRSSHVEKNVSALTHFVAGHAPLP